MLTTYNVDIKMASPDTSLRDGAMQLDVEVKKNDKKWISS